MLIRPRNNCCRIGCSIAQQERSNRLGIATLLQTHHHAIAHLRLLPQHGFQIVGIDVHPLARDDDVLLAALEVEVAIVIERAQVSGTKPAVFAEYRLQLFVLPIPSSHIGAAHQDLAVLVELHLAPFQHLADRALAGMEGMVQRNQRRGFRQPIALDDDETQPPPELLRLGIERRPA